MIADYNKLFFFFLAGHLNNLDYHVCVHAAQGYCGIMYTPTGTDSFLLNGETLYNNTESRKNLVRKHSKCPYKKKKKKSKSTPNNGQEAVHLSLHKAYWRQKNIWLH